MVEVRIRPFVEADRPACQRIAAVAAMSSYGPRLPGGQGQFAPDTPLENVESRLVAVVDDVIAGFVDLTGHHVENLFVDPAMQGRGLGSGLMAAAAEVAGPGDLTLAVFTVNPDARRLYERLGFAVESTGLATLAGGLAEVWRMRRRQG